MPLATIAAAALLLAPQGASAVSVLVGFDNGNPSATQTLTEAQLGCSSVGLNGELSCSRQSRRRRAADGAPDVTFEGSLQLDAIVRLYRRAAALVLPSISEPWGLVVNEAMHVGTPVLVSTRCGCFPELIRDGETGLGMDPSDEGAMAQTLHRFESLPVSERERIGAAGRALAASQSPEGWAERVAQALPRRTE